MSTGSGTLSSAARLPRAERYPADTPVLVSEIVTFLVEYRLFVLDATVHAARACVEVGCGCRSEEVSAWR
ncbi:ATP-grasp domain-containing protein [Micromonospora sp. U56]|nr:ATP-grasp domain-containing protein [Micromonospora sp. U56]